jgi:radical SAM superfamily enzyme YgiQ (UPF0313 family)
MIQKQKCGKKLLDKNTMSHVALISFLTNSINTRSLSSYLKKNGHDVICFFCPVAFNQKNLNELTDLLKTNDIGLVGISLVTDDYCSAVLVTGEIKRKLNVPVIWGGAHVNVKPEECLQHADMICLGEGEEALLDLVENNSEGEFDMSTKNVWLNTENGIVRNELRNLEENLDKYPFPDFDLTTQFVMNEKGFENLTEEHFNGEYSIMTSRGCPYSCHYCYNSYRRKQYKGKGKYLRKRSIENIIDELVIATTNFKNLRIINFWDDSFVTRSIEEFAKFKDLYKARVRLPFFALIEPMAFDYNKIAILKEAGLSGLQVGIQSGSQRVNKLVYNRPVLNKKILEIANFINKIGINVKYDIIFNNPYEISEDVADTVKLLLKFPRPFILQGYNLIFYPETVLTDKALHDNYILNKSGTNDFSTIQSKNDSPLATFGNSAVSNRFFLINYRSDEKKYYNSLISLIASMHVPKAIIKFFARSEYTYKRSMLKIFIAIYTFVAGLKHKVNRNTICK